MSFRPSRGNRTVPSRPDNQPIDDHDDNSSESDLDIKHASSRSKRFTVRKTAEQVKNLQRAYTNNPKPTKEARKVLAEEIGLTERIVTTWFRDQRSSDKKKHVEGGIGPIRHIGDRRARSTRIQSPSVLSDPESEPDVEPRSTAFVTAATPYAPPSIHIHETSSYPTSSSRINVVHPYSPHSKLGHLARLSDDMTVATQPLAPTPASDRWARASPSTWPPSSPKTGESSIRPSEMRIVPTATFPHQSTEWDHASHSGDESDDDDDGLNNHPYTPHTTYRNLSRPQIYTPSPVRSEITLPSLTSEFKRTFPAVPSPGNVQPPENGGWTSEWRWGQYGNISNIRSTLSCAEWTPEPLSDDAASEKSAASPIGSLSLQLPPLRIQGQPPAVFRRTSSPMKLPVILNPEPAPRVHFESRL